MAAPIRGHEVKFHYVDSKIDYENPNFEKNNDTVYFIQDAKEIYVGSNLIASTTETRPKWDVL